jgi:tetratricopeptide (TPR) repeat protein
MRRLVMMLLVTSLLTCAAPYGRSEPAPGAAPADKLEAARMAEQLGDLARLRNQGPLAAANYRTALRDDPQNAKLYNKLGIVELQLGRRGNARKHFLLALKYDPRLIPALNNIGAVALLDKKYKTAIDDFKQALALDESVASTHVNLAECWMGLGKIDRAMTEYTRALELDADVLSNSQDGIQARVTSPQQRALISFLIAKMYMKRGNIDGALDYLSRAKELHYPDLDKVYSDPDFTPLWKDPRLKKIVKG